MTHYATESSASCHTYRFVTKTKWYLFQFKVLSYTVRKWHFGIFMKRLFFINYKKVLQRDLRHDYSVTHCLLCQKFRLQVTENTAFSAAINARGRHSLGLFLSNLFFLHWIFFGFCPPSSELQCWHSLDLPPVCCHNWFNWINWVVICAQLANLVYCT